MGRVVVDRGELLGVLGELGLGEYCEGYFGSEFGYWVVDFGVGVVVCRVFGGVCFVVGGLFCRGGCERSVLLGLVVDWCVGCGWRLSFLNVHGGDVGLFGSFGFSVFKCGEEAFVDLGGFDLVGSRFGWLRRQRSVCVRAGLVVEEVVVGELGLSREWLGVLLGVVGDSLLGKVQVGEWGLLQSGVCPRVWGGRRLWVVWDGGCVVGFVVGLPFGGGFLLDVFRQLRGGVRGVVPFLLCEVLLLLRGEGVGCVSLALVPGRGVDHWLLGWLRCFPLLFDFGGVELFKSRFRPRFEDRFVCSFPGVSFWGVVAFVRCVGLFRVSLLKLLRVWRRDRCWRLFGR